VTAERVWTIRDALAWTVEYLGRRDIDSPRLSAEWLLSAATGLSRVELYAYHDRPLSPDERARFREGIERRAAGEPLQYVTGEMPFRHLVLKVRPGVFIPRPETEVLVDVGLAALPAGVGAEDLRSRSSECPSPEAMNTPAECSLRSPAPTPADVPVVVDLCTGSGAVAVSVAFECGGVRVVATDLNPLAVETAARNAEAAGVTDRVDVFEGDLFAPVPGELRGRVDVVLANPPYIPSADLPTLPVEVLGFEPHLALDGGADGLETARRIVAEAPAWLVGEGTLAMELDETRVAAMADEMTSAGWRDVRVVKDLTGRDRVAAGVRPA
jgi:release factor glutamine methyltransferase